MKNPLLYILLAGFLLACTAFTGHEPATKIKWLTLEQAFAANQKQPRKTLVDIYTAWCGWCKVMDRETFANPNVAAYVNQHYYAVKFDAEGSEPVKIGEKQFKFDAANRTHEAAIALTQGKLSYPTVAYLDEQFNLIQPISGFIKADEFHRIITFLGENHYKKEPFDAYKNGTYAKVYGGLKW